LKMTDTVKEEKRLYHSSVAKNTHCAKKRSMVETSDVIGVARGNKMGKESRENLHCVGFRPPQGMRVKVYGKGGTYGFKKNGKMRRETKKRTSEKGST